jgi:hypothetical protein
LQNWVRVPLNCNVVVMLLMLNWMEHHHLFAISAVYCIVAAFSNQRLAADLAVDALVAKQHNQTQLSAVPSIQAQTQQSLSCVRGGRLFWNSLAPMHTEPVDL